MTAKKCTKKRDAHTKIVVLLIKPIVFLKFLLPSPSSDLKVPNQVKRDDLRREVSSSVARAVVALIDVFVSE